MEEKKNNTPYIVVIILLLLIIGILSYIAFIKNDNKETSSNNEIKDVEKKTEEEKEEKEEKEELTISESELDELEDKIENYNKGLVRFYPLSNLSSLDNQNILQFALVLAEDEDFKGTIKTSEIDETVKEYFGSDKTVSYSDYICDGDTNESNCNKAGALYEYDKGSNSYKQLEVSRGAFFIQLDDNHVKIESHQFEEKELVIKAKVLYGTYVNSSTNPPLYYASLEDSKNMSNSIYEREGTEISDEKVDELLEKVTKITTYRFTKDSKNNYILKSVQ